MICNKPRIYKTVLWAANMERKPSYHLRSSKSYHLCIRYKCQRTPAMLKNRSRPGSTNQLLTKDAQRGNAGDCLESTILLDSEPNVLSENYHHTVILTISDYFANPGVNET